MHRARRGSDDRGRARLGAIALGGLLLLAGCTVSAPAEHASSATTSRPSPTRPSPTGSGTPVTVPIPGITAWSSYHADASRTGAVGAGASLASLTRAWSADLGGAVFGQPVVADGRVIAATETNRVVALDPATGNVVWSVSLGDPLTDVGAVAGCGDIDPLGVTSTPAVDAASGTVFVVGEVSTGAGAVHHQLEGVSVSTGRVVLSEPVDPPLPVGENPVHLLQRASLAVADGRVYISYGGNYGDCGDYHGWVVGVNETGAPDLVAFESAPDGHGGAIWQGGGAPAIDSAGDLYVSTGNSNPDPPAGGPDPVRYAESVVKLSSDLKPLAVFTDRSAGGDDDLGTGNPVLLAGGLLFVAGKTDVGFILRQSDLSQVAGIDGLCGSDPDGGAAYDRAANRLFVPCSDGGIQAVDLGGDRRGPLLSGANGAPIVVGGTVWAVQYPDGTVTQFDASTGARLQRQTVGVAVPHFASPSRALGLLLIGTDTGVVAFRGGG
ncbi:PQQ-binding-like beta-propeller repeat protein [Leifsonia shinshuensis]|uniref:outer membrane protein assembly factor BamB family protein n=1 Tax=Leifsonia shinshuensis TaxID=150026 RepID=UPI001F514A52|nr:PQQ-binding-like beta-propeller repeat protein [Leifsonia shinshuensis]MCI0157131.1 PQQ-binding-like beta-propeller repeat protein [Leifsonia shinshuensis]